MDTSGRIYKAEENAIPAEDIERLKEAQRTAKSEFGVNLTAGTMPPGPPPKHTIERCGKCFEELFDADNGYGGTRAACPTHGWGRSPIITVPTWLEADIGQHPELTRRYVEWVIGEE